MRSTGRVLKVLSWLDIMSGMPSLPVTALLEVVAEIEASIVIGFVFWGIAELHPELVALVRQLRRRRPKGGQRSLREVSVELANRGHLNERGKPFSAARSTRCCCRSELPKRVQTRSTSGSGLGDASDVGLVNMRLLKSALFDVSSWYSEGGNA
jgi:hypothetical protein